MNQIFKKLNSQKVLMTVIYSLVYTLGIELFLSQANLISTGVAGIAQILSYLSHSAGLSISYGLLYLVLNIPGILLGWIKIGKRFTTYSTISIFTVTLSSALISNIELTSDIIINAIFGGMLMGFGVGGLLRIGGSSGGTDFYGVYLFQKYGLNFTSINSAINVTIIAIASLLFGIEIGLYTILSVYMRNIALDQIFTNNHKMTIWIIGNDLSKVSQYINTRLKRGTTLIPNAEGGYSRKNKDIIMTILNQYEYSILLEDIHDIAPDVFINVTETYRVEGNYKPKK